MPDTRSIEEQLTKHLTDVHSIEEQALTQLRRAPEIAGDPELAHVFNEHLTETERQESLVRARLQAHAATPSTVKDLAGKAGGVGMVLFAKANPDTPGKLTAHAYSYEHLELAAYELLKRVAGRAGDSETFQVAEEIAAEEKAMAARLAGCFDRAVDASLRDVDPDDLTDQLVSYLADAHAIEMQAIGLLEHGPKIVGNDALAHLFSEHLAETRHHEERLRERLDAHDSHPSRVKDAALRLGSLNLGGFFGAQPDTQAKLPGFAFAFEHLEIAAYELLKRVAQRAGDLETVTVADATLAEERAAAEKIAAMWDTAVDAALEAQGVTA
jgi:ferritin-like metal-binding protein YciE